MQTDRIIKITINSEEVLSILATDRKISAEQIYNILQFTGVETYHIEKENVDNIDVPVLDFFTELFEEIIKKINDLHDEEKLDCPKR